MARGGRAITVRLPLPLHLCRLLPLHLFAYVAVLSRSSLPFITRWFSLRVD
jgi:hypothetical protein